MTFLHNTLFCKEPVSYDMNINFYHVFLLNSMQLYLTLTSHTGIKL